MGKNERVQAIVPTQKQVQLGNVLNPILSDLSDLSAARCPSFSARLSIRPILKPLLGDLTNRSHLNIRRINWVPGWAPAR